MSAVEYHELPFGTVEYHRAPQVTETRVLEDSQDGAAVMLGTLTLVGPSTSAHDPFKAYPHLRRAEPHLHRDLPQVDLAGSENAKKTMTEGVRLKVRDAVGAAFSE